MIWPATCLTFCNSSGISGLLLRVTTTHLVSRTSSIPSKVNEEETDYKQGDSRTMGCDQTTEMQRHHKAAAESKLRDEIARHTANRNYQMELGRLHEGSLRHSGLDVPGLHRMHELRSKILVNDTRLTQGR